MSERVRGTLYHTIYLLPRKCRG